jgi:hypothetical protein
MSTNRLPKSRKSTDRIKASKVVEYFHSREHAILAEYLELKKKLPKDAHKIDPFEIIPFEDDYDEAKNGIICRPGRGDRSEYGALGNAVARIALAPIRSNLPVWGSYVDGKVFHTREKENSGVLPLRSFRSDPVLVVSINWADSGPGISWPVHYYISWIPYYERYVVTASYDSDDVEGYLDVTIGDLPEGVEIEGDLKNVIQNHWDRDAIYLQGWADCINEGIVNDPWAWREEISWGYDDEGNEACFAEEEETEELDD